MMKIDDTIEHYIMDCQVRSRTGPTIRSYRQHLVVLLQLLVGMCGLTDVEQVTVRHLRQCVQHLMGIDVGSFSGYRQTDGTVLATSSVRAYVRAKKSCQYTDDNIEVLATSSVRAYVRVFKAFFNWCYQEELIDTNPVTRLVSPKPATKVIPSFRAEHIEKMLSVCDLSTEMGFRDYVMLLLLLDTGLRLAEISSLRVSDVQDTYVKVFGKGRKEREVGIHPEVSKLLWKYIHKYRHPVDVNETALFLGRGKQLRYTGVRSVIDRIRDMSGLTDIKFTPHVFRHTFAKMYMEQGGELFKLSREMGHSTVHITEVYLRDFGSSEARKDHTSFSPISGIHLKKSTRKKDRQK